MPEVICGRAHSGRQRIFYDRIKTAAESGQGSVLVIVPDQFSFETEKKLYRLLGARVFNQIQSAGIKAYGERLRREYGGSNKNTADDPARLIAMYRAQTKLLQDPENLLCSARSLLRPVFVSETLTLISDLTKSGVTPEMLKAAADLSPAVSPRLHDIAAVYSAYLGELSEMGLSDVLSEAAQTAELALENGCFKGRTVFFDGFTSFSADQWLIVGAAAAHADDVILSLLVDDTQLGTDPFAQTVKTRSRFEDICTAHGKKLKRTFAGGELAQSKPLQYINMNYFCSSYSANDTAGKPDSEGLVKVASASDVYEESDYICSEIIRLTSEEGFRYGEVAVICGSLDGTAEIFAGAAERYGIPYFIDRTDTALSTLPARYLLSVLDAAASRKYSTDKILRIVKSPLSPFFDYDADDLEEFCRTWGVEGDMWTKPFAPQGSVKFKERIEQTRRAIIEPIMRFRASCESGRADEICKALFTLLDELKMSDQIYSQVRSLDLENETEVEFLRSFKQVWLGMVGSVRRIYELMGSCKMSMRSFSELLRLMLGGMAISSPPQKADCLLIGDAGRSRLADVKILFIMQANDGVFPKKISGSTLLRESDVKAIETLLDKNCTALEISPRAQLDSEHMQLYSAVTAPQERLYVSYSLADVSGSAVSPSQLPLTLRELFSDDINVNISALPLEFFCTSYRTAYNVALEHMKDNGAEAANIRGSLADSPEYAGRLDRIAAARSVPDVLTPDTARRLFFPRDLNISATRVDTFYRCPFNYFCRYGLKLSTPDSMDINTRHRGNIVHYVLQMVMSIDEGGKRVYDTEFPKKTDERLREEVSQFAEEYVSEFMGGDFGKNLTFRDALARLKESAFHMAANFRDEMKNSLFLPAAFEYDLTDEKGEATLSVKVNGIKISLRGMIDRADIYKTDAGTWLRIVDYKTGKQTFDKSAVYHGLDLQMLIYLLAATSPRAKISDSELIPGGIMYSHVKFVEPMLDYAQVQQFEESGELDGELRLRRAEVYKPDGLMVGSEVMPGLNKEHKGVYTVFTLKNDGGIDARSMTRNAERAELAALERFALGKVTDMAVQLQSGNISPAPVEYKTKLTCDYCDFKTLCKDPSPIRHKKVADEDKGLLEDELEKIIRAGLENM